MANQYKGEIKGVSWEDKERTFRLTFECIVNIENRSGKSIMDITNELCFTINIHIKDIVIILCMNHFQGAGGKLYTINSWRYGY